MTIDRDPASLSANKHWAGFRAVTHWVSVGLPAGALLAVLLWLVRREYVGGNIALPRHVWMLVVAGGGCAVADNDLG